MPRIVANGDARRSYFKRKTEDSLSSISRTSATKRGGRPAYPANLQGRRQRSELPECTGRMRAVACSTPHSPSHRSRRYATAAYWLRRPLPAFLQQRSPPPPSAGRRSRTACMRRHRGRCRACKEDTRPKGAGASARIVRNDGRGSTWPHPHISSRFFNSSCLEFTPIFL